MSQTIFRAVDARLLAQSIASFGAPVPAALATAVSVAETAMEAAGDQTRDVLDMTEDELREHVRLLALYKQNHVAEAAGRVAERAASEAGARLRAGEIDEVILSLRPSFDQAAEIVTTAAGYGITAHTSAEQVLALPDAALAAWRPLKAALGTLGKVDSMRRQLSVDLGVIPTSTEMWSQNSAAWRAGNRIDYSVCYAAGDNWAMDGTFYITPPSQRGLDGVPTNPHPTDDIDWFRMAGGGLHLNTVAEIQTKLDARG